jgi:hypothetical protein
MLVESPAQKNSPALGTKEEETQRRRFVLIALLSSGAHVQPASTRRLAADAQRHFKK